MKVAVLFFCGHLAEVDTFCVSTGGEHPPARQGPLCPLRLRQRH